MGLRALRAIVRAHDGRARPTILKDSVLDRFGIDADGSVMGTFRATGIRPRCADRLQAYGIDLAETLFANADIGFPKKEAV